MLVYIATAPNVITLAFGGRTIEEERLAGNNGLECVVEPFSKGMDEACAQSEQMGRVLPLDLWIFTMQ
jgi:hypothetical protein